VKRVISFAPIENDCQLMIELGELVIESRLPAWLIVTWPLTTAAPVGFASAAPLAKHEATATAMAAGLSEKVDCLAARALARFVLTIKSPLSCISARPGAGFPVRRTPRRPDFSLRSV
jgi:hypothetical protein